MIRESDHYFVNSTQEIQQIVIARNLVREATR